jgi:hypothetical protein
VLVVDVCALVVVDTVVVGFVVVLVVLVLIRSADEMHIKLGDGTNLSVLLSLLKFPVNVASIAPKKGTVRMYVFVYV